MAVNKTLKSTIMFYLLLLFLDKNFKLDFYRTFYFDLRKAKKQLSWELFF